MKKIFSAIVIFILISTPFLTLAEESAGSGSNENTASNTTDSSDGSGATGDEDDRSLVLNTNPSGAICDPNIELLKNGGFEDVVVTDAKKWTLFDWNTPNLAWLPSFYGYALEVQAGYTEDLEPWKPYEGNQYAEIDGGDTLQVFQNLNTIPGATYKISFAYSARPHIPLADNRTSILANGVVLGSVSADGTNATTTNWQLQEYNFVATSTQTAFGLLDTSEIINPSGTGMFIDAVSVRCVHDNNIPPPIPPSNTPPVITLIGDNPMHLIVGQIFTDPGATSTDKEDGDLTNQIVKTGTVNTAIEGTYTLTYSVSD